MPQGISPLHSHSSAADLDVKMETLAPKIERLRVCNVYIVHGRSDVKPVPQKIAGTRECLNANH